MNVNKGALSSCVRAEGEMAMKVHSIRRKLGWVRPDTIFNVSSVTLKGACFAKEVPVLALVQDQEWMMDHQPEKNLSDHLPHFPFCSCLFTSNIYLFNKYLSRTCMCQPQALRDQWLQRSPWRSKLGQKVSPWSLTWELLGEWHWHSVPEGLNFYWGHNEQVNLQ